VRGIFDRIASREVKNEESTRYGLVDQMWADFFHGGAMSRSSISVNWKKALTVTTVLACTRRIAEGNATVPFKLYRKVDGKRMEATDHPLYDLLSTKPNDWQSSVEFRETQAFHAVLAGNAYAYKNTVGDKILELILLDPGRCKPKQATDYSINYQLTGLDGSQVTVPAENIWHLRGPSWDTVEGLDIVKLTREAIGLAIATEQSHAAFHANGVRPSGLISVDGVLKEKELIRLAAWVRKNFAGVDNTGKLMAVDRNATFTSTQIKGVDAEHVATRAFQVEQICSALGVMPIMIGHSDKTATYASTENMLLAHLVHTVRPWHRRTEGSADSQLLTREERRQGYYTGFTDGEFLRAAAKDRADFNKIALGGGGNPGWLTPNEVRGHEDLEPINGGDKLYMPQNIAPIGPDGRAMMPETQSSTGA
jgi:HK97 family phage portal protein